MQHTRGNLIRHCMVTQSAIHDGSQKARTIRSTRHAGFQNTAGLPCWDILLSGYTTSLWITSKKRGSAAKIIGMDHPETMMCIACGNSARSSTKSCQVASNCSRNGRTQTIRKSGVCIQVIRRNANSSSLGATPISLASCFK